MVDKGINIIYRDFGANQVTSNANKIGQSLQGLQKSYGGVASFNTAGEGVATSLDNIGQSAIATTTAVKKFDTRVASTYTTITGFGGSMNKVSTSFNAAGQRIREVTAEVEDSRQRFKMYLLSIMFFGMIVQRTFQKMAETTLNTYMKITEAQTTAGQAVTALSAHWELLKFSVGEAIGAFIEANPWILDLIDSITDFVQQNEKLVASLILGSILFGIVLGLVGQLGLGVNGLTMGWTALVGALKTITGAGAAVDTLGLVEASIIGTKVATGGLTAALVPLIPVIIAIIATIAFLWFAWETNFLNIRQITGTVFMGILSLWDGILFPLLRNIGVGIIAVSNLWSTSLGSMGIIWEYTWLAMQRGASIIWNAILGGLQILINGFELAQQAIINLNNAVYKQTGIGAEWDDVTHLDISPFMADTDAMMRRMDELNILAKGALNIGEAGKKAAIYEWDKTLAGVSPGLKAMGQGMIQSGNDYNYNKEQEFLKSANGVWTPQPMQTPTIPISNTNTPSTKNTSVTISNNINVDKMVSDVDIDKLTDEISAKIVDNLKTYGIGG